MQSLKRSGRLFNFLKIKIFWMQVSKANKFLSCKVFLKYNKKLLNNKKLLLLNNQPTLSNKNKFFE